MLVANTTHVYREASDAGLLRLGRSREHRPNLNVLPPFAVRIAF